MNDSKCFSLVLDADIGYFLYGLAPLLNYSYLQMYITPGTARFILSNFKESFIMKVLLIAGARPNFMKIAPIYREALKHNQVQCKIVHTGQHYDYEMSEAFFEDLELPKPDFFLSAGSGSHAVQTAKIMVAFEELCQKEKPDLIIVGW